MRSNVSLSGADVFVLLVLSALMVVAVFIVKGFFRKGNRPVKNTGGLVETDVQIDGMHCGMCEAHINDAIRKLDVSRVSSSYQTGEVIILAKHPVSAQDLHSVIDPLGYTIKTVEAR